MQMQLIIQADRDGAVGVQWPAAGRWFDSWPLQSACQNALGQDTEPQIAPQICVNVCELPT